MSKENESYSTQLNKVTAIVMKEINEPSFASNFNEIIKNETKSLHFQSKYDFSQFKVQLGFKVVEKIYEKFDLNNENERNIAGERLFKIINGSPKFKTKFQKKAVKTMRNYILKGSEFLDFRIDNYNDFIVILEQWQNSSLFVPVEKIEDAIIKHTCNKEEKIRVSNIFSGRCRNLQLENSIKRMELINDKSTMKKKIKDLDNKPRDLHRGKHIRNQSLSYYLRELNEDGCESCKSEDDLEASHRIPLYAGIKNGGVDRSWNMEVLCFKCHRKNNRIFARKYYSKSKKERSAWIKDEYGKLVKPER